MLDLIDLFKKQLPTFNMRGRSFVPSIAGGVLSFAIGFIMLMYATIKCVQMLSRANPNISSYLQTNALDSSQVVNFKDNGVRFAFGVEGYLDKQLKDDPRYVKWIVRFVTKVDGVKEERFVDVHKCTAADLDEFAPPSNDSAALLEAYKTDPDRNLFCLDWDELGDDLAIWGVQDDASY